MNYFESLNQYIIPIATLNEMLNVYKLLGKNDYYNYTLKDVEKALVDTTIEKDTFFLASMLPVTISDNRMRLIITKDSQPRNNDELVIANIKKVLQTIRKDASSYESFNGSDILNFLNIIFKSEKIKFVTSLYQPKNKNLRYKPVSIRLLFENMLEDLQKSVKNQVYERFHLMMVAYMQMSCLQPYTKFNEIGEILFLYYMIFKEELTPFKYVSFLEIYLSFQTDLINARESGSINYPEGRFVLDDIMKVFFAMINQAYNLLDQVIIDNTRDDKAYKSEALEETIYRLPCGKTFTKEELRFQHPNISESTINRTLIKLKNEKVIELVGNGRNARWIKIMADDDPKIIFGRNYETTD